MILGFGLVAGNVVWGSGASQQSAKVQLACFPVGDARTHVKQVRAPNHVVKLANAQLRHDLTNLFSDKKEVVHEKGNKKKVIDQNNLSGFQEVKPFEVSSLSADSVKKIKVKNMALIAVGIFILIFILYFIVISLLG